MDSVCSRNLAVISEARIGFWASLYPLGNFISSTDKDGHRDRWVFFAFNIIIRL